MYLKRFLVITIVHNQNPNLCFGWLFPTLQYIWIVPPSTVPGTRDPPTLISRQIKEFSNISLVYLAWNDLPMYRRGRSSDIKWNNLNISKSWNDLSKTQIGFLFMKKKYLISINIYLQRLNEWFCWSTNCNTLFIIVVKFTEYYEWQFLHCSAPRDHPPN